jgi:hypothetical protein
MLGRAVDRAAKRASHATHPDRHAAEPPTTAAPEPSPTVILFPATCWQKKIWARCAIESMGVHHERVGSPPSAACSSSTSTHAAGRPATNTPTRSSTDEHASARHSLIVGAGAATFLLHVDGTLKDGLEIRYVARTNPSAEALILLSPWPESIYAYLPIWPELADEFSLVAVDTSGDASSRAKPP